MNILVGVCGSIAAYKIFDLVRGLTKQGHEVRVILTQGALEFVRPEVFKHLGAQAVYHFDDDHKGASELFVGLDSKQVLHIALARWAHKIVIAPMTANTLNKLGSGLADDLLSCTFLAAHSSLPKILFPAMNPAMWDNPIVIKNRKNLNDLTACLVHATGSGEMVCGESGEGKLASVDEMLQLCHSFDQPASNKKILITTGATIAPLDPVRYLTNSRSGETGFFLAREALRAGHHVEVIAGLHSVAKLNWLEAHPRFKFLRVKTTLDMRQAVLERFNTCDVYISSAAIGDIHFEAIDGKLKKDQLGDHLRFLRSPDILKEVLSLRKSHQYIIGFAAETNLNVETLEKKWQDKQVDLLVGTKVHYQEGFGDTKAHYILYRGKSTIHFEGTISKLDLALKLLETITHDQTHSLHV